MARVPYNFLFIFKIYLALCKWPMFTNDGVCLDPRYEWNQLMKTGERRGWKIQDLIPK